MFCCWLCELDLGDVLIKPVAGMGGGAGIDDAGGGCCLIDEVAIEVIDDGVTAVLGEGLGGKFIFDCGKLAVGVGLTLACC